ncbi:hypothetical protein, conserved [Eimeria maxima]|uniref:Reactive oxygen species modulator 1 n=1 Tax=Eimeria maxima TaxID=5804 RepID=U6M4D9_EIMMA|nr:hypothetical protein, conserved [Eimeria maxima]CDJ57948.1 hypothetical protein, conserved [Eimeria maxima]
MSWLFGSSSAPQESPAAEKGLPDLPPGLQSLPPPPPPRGSSIPSKPFSGFSDPPPASFVSSSSAAAPQRTPGVSFSFAAPTKETDYNAEDLSKSPYTESSGIRDAEYAADYINNKEEKSSFLDRHITNPRLRGCIDGVKMGMKMGCAVGGIFGGITGTYAAITNRNLLILPFSMIGGALSFGFFLGCGMIIRCQEPKLSPSRGPRAPGWARDSWATRSFLFAPSPSCGGLASAYSTPPLVTPVCARNGDRETQL